MDRKDGEGVASLKSRFPQEDFAMQCVELEYQLVEVADYEAYLDETASGAYASVALNDNHWLLLEPAVPGYGGVDFWMAPRQLQFDRKKVAVNLLEVRCRVRLMSLDSEGEVYQVIEFGMDGLHAEEVVRKSLRLIRGLLGTHLVALPR